MVVYFVENNYLFTFKQAVLCLVTDAADERTYQTAAHFQVFSLETLKSNILRENRVQCVNRQLLLFIVWI